MKRALLIATGTVGGLGAVLVVTPPQFTSSESSSLAMASIGAPAATTATPSATTATPSAKASAKSPAKSTGTKPTKSPAANTPAPVQTTKSVTGTFTGDSVDVRYGFVQVKITVENGKITDAIAV